MSDSRVSKITELLSGAGEAHHVFEQTVLKGVYDQEWPLWYARWVIEHGFNEALGHRLTPEQLGADLRRIYYEQYEKEKPNQGWAEYMAQRLAELAS